MKKAAIILLSCIILGGIVYGLKMLLVSHSPELVVDSPVHGFVTDEDAIEVKGKVSLESMVTIAVISHDKEINVVFAKPSPKNGEYQAALCLRDSSMPDELPGEGTYTIRVSALNAAKKVKVVERDIVFRLQAEEPYGMDADEEQAEIAAQKQAAEEQAEQAAEAQAKLAAQKQAAEEQAKQAAEAQAKLAAQKQAAEEQAKQAAVAQAKLAAQKQATEEQAKQAAVAQAKLAAQKQAAEAQAKQTAVAQAKLAAQKQVAEEQAKQAAEAQAKLAAQKQLAEEQAKLAAQKHASAAQVKQAAEAQAKLAAQKQVAEEQAKQAAEAQAKLAAQKKAAEAQAKQAAEVQAKLAAQKKATEAQAKQAAEAQAKLAAQKQATEAQAKQAAEAQAKLAAQKQVAEEQAKQAAEAQAKLAAQKQVAEEQAKQAAEAQAKLAAQKQADEEQAKQVAETQAKLVAQKQLAEEQAKQAAEAQAKPAAVVEIAPPLMPADAFNAGIELRQSNKIKEAIDAFSKVESADQDYLKALWNISILSLNIDQSTRALKSIEKISHSSGETAFTCFYYGVAYYKMARKQEDADKSIKMYYHAIEELEKAYVKRQDFSRIKIAQVPFNPPQKNIHDIKYYQAMCHYFIYKWQRTQGELEDAELQKIKGQAKDAFDNYFGYFTKLSEDTKPLCNSFYNSAVKVNKEL